MIQLSNRGYPMLRAFAESGSGYYMTISEAGKYDQRPFRSMLIRKWISYRPGRGFHLTRQGADAWREFQSTEIWRKHPEAPMTSLFDPTAYGRRRTLRSHAA